VEASTETVKRMSAKRLLIRAAILVPLLSLALWAFVIEPNRLVINEQTIHLANWPGSIDELRITAISDIHAGSPFMDEDKLRDVVALTNQTNPDLIVLLGDFMVRDTWHSTTIEPEVIAEALKGLQARMGVYAVLGNHDHWYDASRVRAALEKSGIKVLENEVARLEKNKQTIWLVGLADAWTGRDDIAGTSRRVVAEQPVITLTHNPDILPRLPSIFHLTLAGHTHGGQVNLPFLGRRVVPSEFGQRYAAGHILEDGKHLFVTTGIGTSVFPIRFRVPPEIAVLTIKAG
jgi:uncharacterized protein